MYVLVGGLVVLVEEGGRAIEADLLASADDVSDKLVDVLHALLKVLATHLSSKRIHLYILLLLNIEHEQAFEDCLRPMKRQIDF